MDKIKRYDHFSSKIGEELVCLECDVEKLEQENEALHVKNEKLDSLTDKLYAMLDELGE